MQSSLMTRLFIEISTLIGSSTISQIIEDVDVLFNDDAEPIKLDSQGFSALLKLPDYEFLKKTLKINK